MNWIFSRNNHNNIIHHTYLRVFHNHIFLIYLKMFKVNHYRIIHLNIYEIHSVNYRFHVNFVFFVLNNSFFDSLNTDPFHKYSVKFVQNLVNYENKVSHPQFLSNNNLYLFVLFVVSENYDII